MRSVREGVIEREERQKDDKKYRTKSNIYERLDTAHGQEKNQAWAYQARDNFVNGIARKSKLLLLLLESEIVEDIK